MAHGREVVRLAGRSRVDQKGSENIWIAMLGPDTPTLGERANIAPIEQAQISATVCCRHFSQDQVEPYIDTF
jgi:hypothetical protein